MIIAHLSLVGYGIVQPREIPALRSSVFKTKQNSLCIVRGKPSASRLDWLARDVWLILCVLMSRTNASGWLDWSRAIRLVNEFTQPIGLVRKQMNVGGKLLNRYRLEITQLCVISFCCWFICWSSPSTAYHNNRKNKWKRTARHQLQNFE